MLIHTLFFPPSSLFPFLSSFYPPPFFFCIFKGGYGVASILTSLLDPPLGYIPHTCNEYFLHNYVCAKQYYNAKATNKTLYMDSVCTISLFLQSMHVQVMQFKIVKTYMVTSSEPLSKSKKEIFFSYISVCWHDLLSVDNQQKNYYYYKHAFYIFCIFCNQVVKSDSEYSPNDCSLSER